MKPNQYNKVFVLDTNKRQLEPIYIRRARDLLRAKKAAVFRKFPFTIILKIAVPEKASEPELTIKIDPGSKFTGIALVDQASSTVVFAMELEHRGQAIKADLLKRRQIRSGRRSRKTRYREARFNNRARPKGWLPPSLMSRVYNTMTWVNRLIKFSNVSELSVERVKFDMALMLDPTISGKGYQQGTLYGYTTREYVLEKYGRKCVYCDKTDVPLQMDHRDPKSKGGSNHHSNLVPACEPCNQRKGNMDVDVFLKDDPARLARLQKQAKVKLADAAAVNATRNKLLEQLCSTRLPVEEGSGAQTKMNRIAQGYPKHHWIDAACNGTSGSSVNLNPNMLILKVKAMGHGNRQVVRSNKYGFPASQPKKSKTIMTLINGVETRVKTGDIIHANVLTGKYAGKYQKRISAIKAKTGFFSVKLEKTVDLSSRWIERIFHLNDGYDYAANTAA